MAGLVIMARAIFTRFAWPPEMPRLSALPITVFAQPLSASLPMTSSTRKSFSSAVYVVGRGIFESCDLLCKENFFIKYKDSKKIIINPKINNSKEIILNSIKGNNIRIEIKDPKVPDGKTLIYPE